MAITGALFKGYELVGPDKYRVRLSITDSVKGTFERWVEVSGTTLQEITDKASQEIQKIGSQSTSTDLLAGIAINTPVPITYTPPAPSADDIWLNQTKQLVRVKALESAGFVPTGAAATAFSADKAALLSAVNAGTGYTTARGAKL